MPSLDKKISNKTFWILFALIFFISAFLRLYDLDLKPLHHDEGEEQYYFIEPLLRGEGLIWDYDNKGLAHHYLTFIFIKIFGLSIFALRFSPIFFSLLTILLLYFLRDYIGKIGILVSSLFLAVSPFMVYYSRQYTTYPFYLFFLLLIVILLLNFYKKNKPIYLYFAFLLLAVILNINIEAFAIFIFIFLSFLYLNYLFNKELIKKINSFISEIPEIAVYLGIILLVIGFSIIQTGFLSHLENIINLPSSFSELIKKSTETGHNKSFFYYFKILYPFELATLLIGFLGIFYFKKDNFSRFLIYWSLVSLLIFSFIPYKTNWTIPVVILPLFLLAGNTVDYLVEKFSKRKQIILLIIIIFFIASLFFSIEQNFITVNDFTKNKIGYVETSTDINRLNQDIKDYIGDNQNKKILMAAESYWPIPVYLKDNYIWYVTDMDILNPKDYPDYDIFIINQNQLPEEITGFEEREYELRQYYLLSVLYRK